MSKLALQAIGFVFQNFKPFLLRALPAFAAILVLELTKTQITGDYWPLSPVIMTMLYAVFIVSWHRYTLLPEERTRKGVMFSFGLREIKLGAVLLLVYFVNFGIGKIVLSVTPQEILGFSYTTASYLFFLISSLLLFFVYPAIAIDHPIRLKLFWSRAFRLFFSFVFASLLAIGVLIIISILQLVFHYLIDGIGAGGLVALIPVLIFSYLIIFLQYALLASTASFLYRDVIGLRGDDAEATSPPPA